jgi:ABC-type sugar transport system ATPase subunit
MARIDVEAVTRRYERTEEGDDASLGRRAALDGVSLQVADGETISLVGGSGCGKSTLLKVVAGLEYPDQGRVLYDDEDVTYTKPQDRGVGMVFQDYALYPSMKGKGNLAYYFEVNDKTQAEAEQRVRETAELMGVGFETLLGRVPTTLSGGEQQRVSIARCIVREPRLFLMDEPISNLDAKLRERTRTEMKKLLRKFNVTTLYVTHDQREAVFMGDRIAVMRDGKIEQVGTFDDLYYAPVNLFVAAFIGTPPIAVLPAERVDGRIGVAETAWDLPPAQAAEFPTGPVRLGVRPEGWRLDTPDGAPLAVRRVERLPTEQASFVHGTLAGTSVTVVAPLNYAPQDVVRVTPDWEAVHLFAADGETVLHAPGVPDLF